MNFGGFGQQNPAAGTPAAGSLGVKPGAPAFGATSTSAFGATSTPAFGATSTPAFGATSTPSFGATSTPAFGATSTPAFGATSTPSFGVTAAPSFGATAAPSFGATAAPSFGATATPSFGATATPSFGATATPSFGATATPSFGATATPATNFGTGTSFGVPASTASTLSAPQTQASSLFALPAASTKPATQPATSAAPTLFGAPQATPGLFASTSAASSAPTSSLFSGLSTSKPATQFGTTTAPASTNFGTGSSFPSLLPTSSAAPAFSLGGSTAPATTTASVGLGGVDSTASAGGITGLSGLAGAQNARPEAKSPKESQIPDDIARGVETFRQYVKKQKSFSSKIATCSSKPLLKVQEDTDAMKQVLSSNTASLQRLRSVADKLKADTAKALQHCEMAQRTHDTPPGLQYDNTAPLQYFSELVAGFERDIKLFRQEIENAERHVHSRVQVTGITPAELTQAMRRLYDSFVALAGRLHSVHSQVKAQKEQYLSLRRYILNDSSDVFDEATRSRVNGDSMLGTGKGPQSSRTIVGPTPFSALNAQHGFGLLSAAGVAASSRQNFPAVGPLGWSAPANTPGSTSLPLTPHTDNSQFQLQKPPAGNKRGKR